LIQKEQFKLQLLVISKYTFLYIKTPFINYNKNTKKTKS